MDISSLLVLLGFIAACFLAALTGALFRPGEMVRATSQTVVATAEPAVRTGVDRPVSYNRCFRLAGLAGGRFCRRRTAAHDLCLAARAERRLDAALLWPAPS